LIVDINMKSAITLDMTVLFLYFFYEQDRIDNVNSLTRWSIFGQTFAREMIHSLLTYKKILQS